MFVNHSGWNSERGSFSYDIFVDERREDYALHFSDGKTKHQRSPFSEVTADWNHDGDVYTQFGAWFSERPNGNGEFWTPEDMVAELIDALDPDRRRSGAHIVSIPGIEVPTPDKRPSLTDKIRQSENRAMHQDIEKNRKMNALGIRGPGEPWAR